MQVIYSFISNIGNGRTDYCDPLSSILYAYDLYINNGATRVAFNNYTTD